MKFERAARSFSEIDGINDLADAAGCRPNYILHAYRRQIFEFRLACYGVGNNRGDGARLIVTAGVSAFVEAAIDAKDGNDTSGLTYFDCGRCRSNRPNNVSPSLLE